MKGKYTQGHQGGGSNLKKSKLIYIEHISHQLLYPIIPVLIQPFECILICRLQKPSTSPKATLWAYIIGIWNVKTTLFLENSNHHSAMKFKLTGASVEKGGAAGREEWIIFSRCTNNLSNRIDSIDLWLHVKLVQYRIVWYLGISKYITCYWHLASKPVPFVIIDLYLNRLDSYNCTYLALCNYWPYSYFARQRL